MSFLPRARGVEASGLDQRPSIRAAEALVAGCADCNAICVDDRHINNHAQATAPTGESVPVVCVLDLLRYLLAESVIDDDVYHSAKVGLRRGGFAWVPVEAGELTSHLGTAIVEDDGLVENAELRILRQSLNWMDAQGLLQPHEAQNLVGGLVVACMESIRTIWMTATVPVTSAAAQCNWIWRNLLATRLLPQTTARGDQPDGRRHVIATRLSLLFLPLISDSKDRRLAYGQWVDRSIVAGFVPANGELIHEALQEALANVRRSDRYQELIGPLFFECLPESLRSNAVSADPELARRCGFESVTAVGIGTMSVAEDELFQAAESVLSGDVAATVRDRTKDTEITVCWADDVSEKRLAVRWRDATGQPGSASISELMLLSPDAEARQEAFAGILEQVGPTVGIPMELVEAASARRLTHDEVSSVLLEGTGGVASFHARLRHRVWNGLPTGVEDVVPRSLSYWERLCGPLVDGLEPESYIRDRLIPFRRELLNRDLSGSLKMCCIGALRDDLMPAQWITTVDDDTVWDALRSIDMTGNPLGLLAALDVAMLRSEDARFRDFATDAVRTLLDRDLGLTQVREVYRLHQIVYGFVINAMSLSDQTSTQPGFWRRMGAWMHTGMSIQTLVAAPKPIDVDSLAAWCQAESRFAGEIRRLADCRREPMVLASQIGAGSLRYETAAGLLRLLTHHAAAGHDFPMAEEVARTRGGLDEAEAATLMATPRPMAFHLPPTEPMPEPVWAKLREASQEGRGTNVMGSLAAASQLYALSADHTNHARSVVERLPVANRENVDEHLQQLYSASILAAATRHTEFAGVIGDAARTCAHFVSETAHVEWLVRVLLQAAAAQEDENEWGTWLEERFADTATALPAKHLEAFRYCTDEIETVLPAGAWFHLRAKAIATAGMA